MTVSIATRWIAPNIAASTENAKRAKAMWIKHGAQDARLSQIFTGQFTGQYIFVTVFADMAAYGKAMASAATELQQILSEQAKNGAVLQERTILVGIDL